MRIIDVCARWPGSTHDSTIYRNSEICQRFERGEFGADCAILGDSAYATGEYLCKPLAIVTNQSERSYQNAQTRSRNVVERTFGLLKRRFPCLFLGLDFKLQKVQDVIIACCILHNMLLVEGDGNVNDILREEIDFQDDIAMRFQLQQQVGQMTIQNFLIYNHFIE